MSAPDPRLVSALADRYRIERDLGAGGMATVYLAEDLKHQRKVAVKVLRPELAAALGHERFLREITTTANLRHPHILPLYDSGATDQFLFYVMPYVEGETLRDRIAREKQLPLDDALQIAREVADALSYAHARGVIHRDIKPENILLESGHAVVADFGIARAVDAAGGDRLTETGMSIGTPAYMSPEQAAGESELDGRSDLYALACVVYEMLAGQAPFVGPTAESLVRQHLASEPRAITEIRPAVPPNVAGVLQRALAKNPADRFSPVAQFADALRARPEAVAAGAPPPSRHRQAAVIGVLILVGVVVGAVWGLAFVGRRAARATPPSDTVATASVAVLPFADLSGGQDEYLGDGIAETLISALSRLEGLRVAARTSAFSFKGRQEDVRVIGEQLGVRAVLEGSVQRAANRLRITAQLVNTADGFHLWSHTFDRDMSDVFAVQDEVARAVVTALQVELLGDPTGPVVDQGTTDLTAYNAYLQGRYFWNKRTSADLVRAAAFFDQAIAADSGYAMAWAGLAATYVLYGPSEYDVTVIPAEESLPRAEDAARHALLLNDGLAEAHTALAAILQKQKAWEESGEEYRRAIELDPRYATARQWYGGYLVAVGRADDGLAQMERAAELDPLSTVIAIEVAELLDVVGRRAEAAEQYEKVIALFPDWMLTQYYAGVHFLRNRDFERAAGHMGRYVIGWSGDSSEARRVAEGIRDPARRQAVLLGVADTSKRPEAAAAVHLSLGDEDAAVSAFERAVDGPFADFIYLPHVLAVLGPELTAQPSVQAALERWRGRR